MMLRENARHLAKGFARKSKDLSRFRSMIEDVVYLNGRRRNLIMYERMRWTEKMFCHKTGHSLRVQNSLTKIKNTVFLNAILNLI